MLLNRIKTIIIMLSIVGGTAYGKMTINQTTIENDLAERITKSIELEALTKGVYSIEVSNKIQKCSVILSLEIGGPFRESHEQQYAIGISPGVKNKNKIKWMKIYYGKNLLYLPVTAYNQLGYVRRAELIMVSNKLQFIIYGGDTGDAYVCELIFDKNRLREKILRPLNDMVPPSSEITIYRADAIDNPKLVN